MCLLMIKVRMREGPVGGRTTFCVRRAREGRTISDKRHEKLAIIKAK